MYIKWFNKLINKRSIFIIFVCLIFFYSNILLAEIYRYVDPDGISHYSDPDIRWHKNYVKEKNLEEENKAQEKIRRYTIPDGVTLFTDTLGSESHLKETLNEENVSSSKETREIIAEKTKGKLFNKSLIIAAKNGHINTVETLLSQGADVNVKDDDGFTALMHAAASGHADTVRALLINGASVNAEDRDGSTALIHAAGNGHTDVVKILLSKSYNVNKKRKDGFTALSVASTNGHIDTVNTLLDKGADVNAKDIDGSTALIYASMNGHNNTVKALLNKGADINEREKNGLFSPLMAAAFNGHTDTVNTLLARGANVNEKDKVGFTPLMKAATNGHTDTVMALLAQGADVNMKEKNGRTALEFAILKGHHRIVQLLKENIYNETFPFAETLKTKEGNLEKEGKLQEIGESTATHLPGYSFFSFLAVICLVLSIIYFSYIYLYKKAKKWDETHQDQDSNLWEGKKMKVIYSDQKTEVKSNPSDEFKHLTSEDRQRIYEEEKVRLEAKEDIQSPDYLKAAGYLIISIVFGAISIFFLITMIGIFMATTGH